MKTKERMKLVAIIAIFVLAGMTINHAFVLLSPLPDSPEVERAKAKVLIMQTEANLQNQHLYRTFMVGAVLVLSGIVMCFGSLLLALHIVKSVLGLNKAPIQTKIHIPIQEHFAITQYTGEI